MSDDLQSGAGEPLKRFYESASVAPLAAPTQGAAHTVLLDGRNLKTPARASFSAPRAVAERAAAEWNAQGEFIAPLTMPLTRLVNSAIDGVAWRIDAVQADIAAIAASDLVLYRADQPEGLVAEQRARWDPLVAFGERRLGVRLVLTEGIMPVRQDDRLAPAVRKTLPSEPLELAALHQLTTLTGSAFIAIALMGGALEFEEAWRAAHVDEDWNIKEWGEDAEAKARRDARRRDAEAAAFVLTDTGAA